MTGRQDRVSDNESPTAGYGVLKLDVSYTVYSKGTAHIFTLSSYNLTDKLYFNHLSFLKDIAPEIGRGARLTYTVRF